MILPIIEALKTAPTNKRTPITPRYVSYETNYESLGAVGIDCKIALETKALFSMTQFVDEIELQQNRDGILVSANERAKRAISHEIYGPVLERLFAVQRGCWERGDEEAGEEIGQLIRDLRI